MIGVFISGLVFYYKKKHYAFVNGAPSILTSIGILGTFAGIVIGLVGFDTTDIDKSIPILLEGLKVAFISSLVGVALSIFFKVVLNFIPNDEADISEVDDLMTGLKKIEDVIAKDDGKSLYSQFKLLRSEHADALKRDENRAQDFSDQLWRKLDDHKEHLLRESEKDREISKKRNEDFSQALWKKFDDFSEMLSESASKHVIQALESVITDFNNNLKEQFGENFKQLNESVKELVIWQENYKHQIAEMTQQYQLSVESIKTTEEAIKSIQDNTNGISKTAEQLKSIIETNHNQINDLSEQLKAFSTIKDKAIDAMPVIEESLNSLTEEIKKTTKEAQTQVSKIDKALAKEIEDKLSEMGSALASITGKFTSDYQTLVREMQSVVSQR